MISSTSRPILQFDPAYASAFGTLETGELTPVLQGDFVYGLNIQTWNTGIVSGTGATVDTSVGRLRLQSGTDPAGYAYITSKKIIRYRAGQGTMARFTPLFSTGLVNNIQLWGVGNISANVPVDGYFFGYNGVTFGIYYYNNGTAIFYPRTSWTGDHVDGTPGTSFNWNPVLGSPVMIKYPYLGYGDVFFYIQNPASGSWVLVHTIQYANTSLLPELSNPSLQFIGYTINTGNTTNISMYTASVGMFISGNRNFISNPKWAMDSNKLTVTTEVAMMSIRNCTTYNGVTNRGMIRLNGISFASATNSVAVMMFKIGATLGGSPVFNPIKGTTADNGVTITAGNSIASYDTAATTVAAGNYIFNTSIGSTSNAILDLTPFEILIAPSEILTISCKASASSTLSGSINWSEDI